MKIIIEKFVTCDMEHMDRRVRLKLIRKALQLAETQRNAAGLRRCSILSKVQTDLQVRHKGVHDDIPGS